MTLLSLGRRLFRRVFPRLLDPWLDSAPDPRADDERLARAYEAGLLPEQRTEPFLAARYVEGMRWRSVLDRAGAKGLTLDVGSGTGAIALANEAGGRRMVTVDSVWNESARHVFLEASVTNRHVIADAAHLPFRDGSFGAVTCLETIEHLPDAAASGKEMARVLRPGGCLVLITPPRLAWLFRPDPHFGIHFLLLFPPALQRAIAAKRGFGDPHHFVDRIYTSSAELVRLFPDLRLARTMTRSRLPKRWFWDALLLTK